MASRVPLLAAGEAPLLARRWYREDGSASPLTRSLATVPEAMEALMPFLGAILGESTLDLATKELAIVRVSELNRCRYCLAAHRPVALAAGVDVDAPPESLPARERAIVAWVDRVTLDPHGITDELVAETLAHVRDFELVELTLLAGATTMLNLYCTALDIPPP